MNRQLAFLFVMGIAAVVTSTSVRADGGYFGSAFPWFGYGNNGPAAYALGNIPAPPYFALHPPVYYSHSIARPYGASPFACPCNCHHGRHESARRVFVNPYIESVPREIPTKSNAKTTSQVAAVPVRIANPYFQSDKAAETKLASRGE